MSSGSMIECAPRARQRPRPNSPSPRRVAERAAAALGAIALAATCAPALRPPREAGPFRAPDLVELVTLDPTIHLDVRYATSNNFVGRPLYRQARAFLQRPAAEALVRAHQGLRAKGYGLVVFDGYRPWSVPRLFWGVTPEDKQEFLAGPRKGSRAKHGC